jgi:hypothetical protein
MLRFLRRFFSAEADAGSPPPTTPPPPPEIPAVKTAQPGMDGFHANQELVPQNELEQILADSKAGKVTWEELLNYIVNSEVAILDTDFQPDAPNLLHAPLLQYGPTNEALLAVFSSPTRATPHRNRRPEFKYLKTMKTINILRSLPPDLGLVVNSGWKVGLQLHPDEVQRIKQAIRTVHE